MQTDAVQDPIPGRPDLPDILQALQSMQPVEACQEKEEGEMMELIGFMFFIGGLIWLALMWWPLWIVYMVIFGWSLLDD